MNLIRIKTLYRVLCLSWIRLGEDIILLRLKASWVVNPVSGGHRFLVLVRARPPSGALGINEHLLLLKVDQGLGHHGHDLHDFLLLLHELFNLKGDGLLFFFCITNFFLGSSLGSSFTSSFGRDDATVTFGSFFLTRRASLTRGLSGEIQEFLYVRRGPILFSLIVFLSLLGGES